VCKYSCMQVYLHAGVLAYVIELIAVASAPVPRQPSLEMCWLREESTLTRRFHAPREDPQKRADSILRLPPYAHAKALYHPAFIYRIFPELHGACPG
jgi:hypothetical protein